MNTNPEELKQHTAEHKEGDGRHRLHRFALASVSCSLKCFATLWWLPEDLCSSVFIPCAVPCQPFEMQGETQICQWRFLFSLIPKQQNGNNGKAALVVLCWFVEAVGPLSPFFLFPFVHMKSVLVQNYNCKGILVGMLR